MQVQIKDLIHPRLLDQCLKLYHDGHFRYAAVDAMHQVETALREKGVAPPSTFGQRLVQKTFGRSSHIMLSVPLGDKLQDDAAKFFEGAFAYYRNYSVHDGAMIDKTIALRIMILASELLDIIGASKRSFTNLGGLGGLLEHKFFDTPADIAKCLRFLNGNSFPDTAMDSYWEKQAEAGISDKQIEIAFDLDLVMAQEEIYKEIGPGAFDAMEVILTTFSLTDLGKKLLEESEALLRGSNAH